MIGTKLSRYRVTAKLGAGGMGVVYRATDERLRRDVALKVLPEGVLTDDVSRERFRREALTLGRLNHPNVCSVHDFDTQDGVDFLVMELVEGRTLADRLAGGPVGEREAVAIAVQIAEALEEAHGRGIVHRDLKPRNVMVTARGLVKVLDFGLAKQFCLAAGAGSAQPAGPETLSARPAAPRSEPGSAEPAGLEPGAAPSPRLVADRGGGPPTDRDLSNEAGRAVDRDSPASEAPLSEPEATWSLASVHGAAGTLPYMAPEQLDQAGVDHRTDLYALGAVLYEMLTGRRPYTSRLPSALAAEIRRGAPPTLREIDPGISPRLEAIVLKALRKDPAERYVSAREMLDELRASADDSTAESRASPARGNLPRPLSSFVGREAEIAELRRRLETTRLLTLVGSGGCGKTRLAIEASSDLLAANPGGVWLVELGPLSDPGLVPQAVASSLGLGEEPGRSVTRTLVERLRVRRTLIVLDNCEHLLDAAARLAETLLRECPVIAILATSREALGIPGEICWRVPSLALPDPELADRDRELDTHPRAPVDLSQLERFAAVRLFVERARAVEPSFALTEESASAVVQICRRLDGIPLAIELAAACVRALSPRQIAERLDDRFHLLTVGSRTALPRQKTLRALIDYSWEMLSGSERALFRRLSVFAGGWTLEAAEAIGSGEEGLDDRASAHDAKEEDAARNGTVREAAEQKGPTRFGAGGEGPARDGRTRDDAVPKGPTPIGSGAEGPARDGARPEEAAAERAIARGEVLELLAGLVGKSLVTIEERAREVRYSLLETVRQYARDRLAESEEAEPIGRWHFEYFLRVAERPAGDLAKKLTELDREQDNLRVALEGSLARKTGSEAGLRLGVALVPFWKTRGSFDEGRQWLERLLAASPAAVLSLRARAFESIGALVWLQGLFDEADAWYRRALDLYRDAGDRSGIARAVAGLGNVARYRCEYPKAGAAYSESLALYREIGDEAGVAHMLNNLGAVALNVGDLPRATSLYTESLAVSRSLGDTWGIASRSGNLAEALTLQGRLEEAEALHRESLSLWRTLGDRRSIVEGLEMYLQFARARGDLERLARLLGLVDRIRRKIGYPRPPVDQKAFEGLEEAARGALGETAFRRLRREGRSMSIESALADLLGEA